MQIYTSKPTPLRTIFWDGSPDSPARAELEALGLKTFYQAPETETERDWDDDKGEEITVPALGRLVICGPYVYDTWHVAPNHHIALTLVTVKGRNRVEWTDDNLKSRDIKISLGDFDQTSLDKHYDLVG